MPKAWLEPICAVIRVGADGANHYDDYYLVATLRYTTIDEAEVVGLVGNGKKFTVADRRAIAIACRNSGLKMVHFCRVVKMNGVNCIRNHSVNLEKMK